MTIIHPVRFTCGQLKWVYTAKVLNGLDRARIRVLKKTTKSWNFIVAFSGTGKSWKKSTVVESSGNLLSHVKNMKSMADSKEDKVLEICF